MGVCLTISLAADGDTYGALVGDIDGVNTTFTVSKGQYISGSLQVFLNGQLLIQGSSEGWVETTPGSGIFDLNDAPVAGDELSTSYQTVSDVVGTGDRTDQSGGAGDTYGVLSGTIDGVNTTFTVSAAEYVSGTLRVYLNGQLQTQGTSEDWTEANSDVGQFDFATPPVSGDQITVTYKIPGAGSGDADTLDGYHAANLVADTVYVATEKTTPVDADEIGIWDSVASALNKATWANVKATLKAYFDTLYATPGAAETRDADIFRCNNPGGQSTFHGTIATLPGGATLTYNITSGQEGAMTFSLYRSIWQDAPLQHHPRRLCPNSTLRYNYEHSNPYCRRARRLADW